MIAFATGSGNEIRKSARATETEVNGVFTFVYYGGGRSEAAFLPLIATTRARDACPIGTRDQNTNIIIVTHVYRCPLSYLSSHLSLSSSNPRQGQTSNRTHRTLMIVHRHRAAHRRCLSRDHKTGGYTGHRATKCTHTELHELNELSRAVHLIEGKGKKFTFTCADALLTPAPAQLADDGIAHRSLRRLSAAARRSPLRRAISTNGRRRSFFLPATVYRNVTRGPFHLTFATLVGLFRLCCSRKVKQRQMILMSITRTSRTYFKLDFDSETEIRTSLEF